MTKTNLKIAGAEAVADCAAFLAKQKLGVKTFNGAEIVLTDENGDSFAADVANIRRVKNSRLVHNCAVFVKKYMQDYTGKDFTGKKFSDLVPYVEEILAAADEAAELQTLKFIKP